MSEIEVRPEDEKPKALKVKSESGLLLVNDNSELLRVIQIMMQGQAFPKTIDTPAKAIACWQVAASLKIPPAIAIQNMAVIHGSVCVWGQLPKALAEATGEMEEFRLVLIDQEQKVISLENKNLHEEVWGAVCSIKRKGRTLNEYTFTMKDAHKAGLSNKTGPWKDYTKIMLSRRAVAHAIKFEFPDALMGVPVAEYDHNQAPDIKDVTPRNDQSDKLNQFLNKAKEQNHEPQETDIQTRQ